MAKLFDAVYVEEENKTYDTSISDVNIDLAKDKKKFVSDIESRIREEVDRSPELSLLRKSGKWGIEKGDFDILMLSMSERWKSYESDVEAVKSDESKSDVEKDSEIFKLTSDMVSSVIAETSKSISDNVVQSSILESENVSDLPSESEPVQLSKSLESDSSADYTSESEPSSSDSINVTGSEEVETSTDDVNSTESDKSNLTDSKLDEDTVQTSSSKESVLPKTDEVFKDFVSNSFSTIDSANETVENYASNFEGYGDTILATISKPIAATVSDVIDTVVRGTTDAVFKSDVASYIANPGSIATRMTSGILASVKDDIQKLHQSLVQDTVDAVDNLVNAGIDSVGDTIDSVYESVTQGLRDGVKGLHDKIQDALDPENVKDWLKGKANDTIETVSETIKDTVSNMIADVVGTDPLNLKKSMVMDAIQPDLIGTFTPKFINAKKILKSTPVKRSDFVNNNPDIVFTNDVFWDIEIKPHKEGTSVPPSLNAYYGDSQSRMRLPIVSYEYSGKGIQNQEFELYGGTFVSLPAVYVRPSKFSVSIVDMYNSSEGYSCLQQFRDKYIDYTMSEPSVFRDYRECCYEITITRFSPQWVSLKTWRLLGLPEIQDIEQGSSSSSPEYVTLSFAIVGEG